MPSLLSRFARLEEKLRAPLLTALLGLGALACLVLTPPFQSPDAGAHFLRAFQIAQGQWLAEKRGDQTGGELPRAAIADANRYSDLQFHRERTLSRSTFVSRLEASAPLTREATADRAFVGFSNTALYSPIPYIPQALGIALAIRLHIQDIAAFYLASLFSLCASLLCLFLALRTLQFSLRTQCIVFAVAGLPMSLFLLGSLSADGPTISLCALNFALALRLRARFEPRLFLFFIITCALISLCKTIYFFAPLAALPFILGDIKLISRAGISRAMIVLSAALVPTLSWSALTRSLFSPMVPGINPTAQLDYTLHHFIEVLNRFAITLYGNRRDLLTMLLGQLGWLDTPLSRATRNTSWALLLLAPLLRESAPPKPSWNGRATLASSLFAALVFACFVFALCLTSYLAWSPVGGALGGIQGRYFLPFLFILLAGLPAIVPAPAPAPQLWLLGLVTAWCTVAVRTAQTLALRYWS